MYNEKIQIVNHNYNYFIKNHQLDNFNYSSTRSKINGIIDLINEDKDNNKYLNKKNFINII